MAEGQQFRRRCLPIATLPAHLQKRGYTNEADPLARARPHRCPYSSPDSFPPLGDARRRSHSSQWTPQRLSSLSCCESSSLLVHCRGFFASGRAWRSFRLSYWPLLFLFSLHATHIPAHPSLLYEHGHASIFPAAGRWWLAPKAPVPCAGAALPRGAQAKKVRSVSPARPFPDCQLSPAAARPGAPGGWARQP